MKNNVNPVAIGMFVLAAAVISVAAIMVFGAAKFFTTTEKFVSYFSETANGLDVGAPLKYKGVTIGKVESIMIRSNSATIRESSVMIVYSIDIDMLRRKTGKEVVNYETWLDMQIEDGLRAKLNYLSIVTGMLYIELDFFAQKNEKFELNYKGGRKLKEIPSAKSGLAELAKSLEATIREISQIKFTEIGENVNQMLVRVNTKLDQIDMVAMNKHGVSALKSLDEIVASKDMKDAPKNINKLLLNLDDFVKNTDAEVKKLSSAGQTTFSNIDSVLKNVDSIVAPQSPLRYELALMIRALSESMNSLSNLTDYLERNPSALLTGKFKQERKAENE